MPFLAQIDLAEVAATGATLLPASGALAFFVGATGQVVYVPPSHDRSPTRPPADMPELSESGGSPDWRGDHSGQRLYPFWPLDFTALQVPPFIADDDDDDHTALQVAAVERHFKRRQHSLSADLVFAGPPIPDWWQVAIHFADDLAKAVQRVPGVLQKEQGMLDWAHEQVKQALPKGEAELKKAEASVALYEGRLATARVLLPAFLDFVSEVTSWTAGRDPWAPMGPEDLSQLAAY